MSIEPVGLAIGLGGILLAFKGVVDTVNLFELIAAADNGSRHLALRYYIERQKTSMWGDEYRPEDDLASPLLAENESTRRLVAGVLIEIQAIHALAHKSIKRYSLTNITAEADSKSLMKDVASAREVYSQSNKFLWATNGKGKFEELVSRLADLNNDLRALVRPQSPVSLAAAISATLLPQIKETISLIALQQAEDVEPLLKAGARLRELQQPAAQSLTRLEDVLRMDSVFIPAVGSLGDAQQIVGTCALDDHKYPAWIEWVSIPSDLELQHRQTTITRLHNLVDMLLAAQDPAFAIPPCLGLVEDFDHDPTIWRKLGMTYTAPIELKLPDRGPLSLAEHIALTKGSPPLLEDRFELARRLASAVWLLHAAQWIHKGIRTENVKLFLSSDGQVNVRSPWLTGFTYSRHESQASIRDRVKDIPDVDIYYHPDVPTKGFSRLRDIYSLGVVLLEIAIWTPLPRALERYSGRKLETMTMIQYRELLMEALGLVGSAFGSSYQQAVSACLTGTLGNAADDVAIGRAFYTTVIQKLGYCRA